MARIEISKVRVNCLSGPTTWGFEQNPELHVNTLQDGAMAVINIPEGGELFTNGGTIQVTVLETRSVDGE